MRELHLYAGAGGGILASLLLGNSIVGAVEINEYRCKVLEQRQRDGILERFPIFQTDIRDFIRHGYASLYKGCCDLVSGGFPCQPFSNAGRQLGADDPRNMWPATEECLRIIRPRFGFFENVPGLLSSGYFGRIVADLAALSYGVRWGVLSACAFGAPHTRERLFILAYSDQERCKWGGQRKGGSSSNGRREKSLRTHDSAQVPTRFCSSLWDSAEADILGVADGLGTKVERIGATGDGQVPVVVANAWHLLTEGLDL